MSFAHIILIIIPLFFSHIFSKIGIIFGEESSFERVKVWFFLVLVLGLFIETTLMRFDELRKVCKKWYPLIFLAIGLPILSFAEPRELFFLGSYEKHHGYLFWIGIVIFTLSLSTQRDKKSLIRTSLLASVLVACIGIAEWAGLTLMESDHESTWGIDRIISTLGNPNYVAGYLLIHLPLIAYLRGKYRLITTGILVLAIILTRSYIAIALLVLYFLMNLSRKVSLKGPIIVMISSLLLSIGIWGIIPNEKKLSLETRGILMTETLRRSVESPLRFLIGHGPDSVITYFSRERSKEVEKYISDDDAIDSSHSIIIDTLYSYGLIVVSIIGYFLMKNLPNIPHSARDGLILGIIFFSMNVIVLAPLLVMILLAETKKEA